MRIIITVFFSLSQDWEYLVSSYSRDKCHLDSLFDDLQSEKSGKRKVEEIR